MNVIALRAWSLLLLIILTVSTAVGCADVSGTPVDQVQIVTDSVQTSSDFYVHNLLSNGNFSNLSDGVAGAFFHYASIKVEYHDTNDNLPPPYNSPNYPAWPDWNTSPTFYDDYARQNHDTLTYPWVVFYIDHMVANRTDSCAGFRPGVSSALLNQPLTRRASRYSFILASDVQLQGQLCAVSTQQQENVMIHVVTHEYGHQRAGLTDYFWQQPQPNNSQYHQGQVASDREDVMAYPESDYEILVHTDPVFDALVNDFSGNNTTCKGNLLTNNPVH